ncbi:hypothetical protein L915_02216 [Phytophthora nicotianae]|uniref:Uncharacterized protein n=1 Tax=Phytophthora nicotianae TaxID=4792 RepID=W2HJN1_PHYNI|nr:hypothetical protein L915_02216 [Phytophthora nicotianae]
MVFFGKLLIAVGTLLLVHAGYYSVQCTLLRFLFPTLSSCISYRRFDAVNSIQPDESYVKLTETADAQMPPFEVVVELVAAFLVSLVGVLLTSGEILPIRSNDALHSRCDVQLPLKRNTI